jgi:hypothetical protein
MAETYFRYEDELLFGSQMKISLIEFEMVRKTPKGARIKRRYGIQLSSQERFVLDGPGKRYAYPTKEAALESFLIRKRRQIQHLETDLIRAKAALQAAEAPDFEANKPFTNDTLSVFHEY